MRIGAVSDIHCPRYIKELELALRSLQRPDLILFAKDMIEAGRFAEYRNIVDIIESSFTSELPVIACIGNDEQGIGFETLHEIVDGRITFLDESTFVHSSSLRRATVRSEHMSIGFVESPSTVAGGTA